jgi:hypothetical protein
VLLPYATEDQSAEKGIVLTVEKGTSAGVFWGSDEPGSSEDEAFSHPTMKERNATAIKPINAYL